MLRQIKSQNQGTESVLLQLFVTLNMTKLLIQLLRNLEAMGTALDEESINEDQRR